MKQPEQPLAGAAWTLVGVVTGGLLLMLPKLAANDLPPVQITFFRYIAGVLSIAPFYLVMRARSAREDVVIAPDTKSAIWWHVLRAIFAVTRLSCVFYAVTHMPFANVQAITLTNGVFMIVFAALLLGERVKPVTAFAAAICFVGGIIAAEPSVDSVAFLSPGALAALAGALIWGVESAVIKHTAARDSVPVIVFTVNLVACAIIAIPGLLFWQPLEPSQWAILALMGPFAIATQAANILAFRLAPANVLAPFRYSSVIFALLIGWLVFNEWPSYGSFAGMGLILIGGIVLAHSAGRRPAGSR